MNKIIGIATCLTTFAIVSLAMPALAYKSAPIATKSTTKNVIAKASKMAKTSKVTKKNKKVALEPKASRVIACGKK